MRFRVFSLGVLIGITQKIDKQERQVQNMGRILWIILVVILAVWVIGFLLDVAGGLIHILLIIAAIVLIVNLVTGRKGV
ncbi:hypothetical protein BHE17_03915 [Planococcus maritimus]|nr:hypothetical protein BHE17_03915 [Planococcus maritimus]